MSMDDQMKTALKYFQLSSGIFSFLKDYVSANSLSDLSVDFEPAVLASLSWLMLGQAAELIHLKSASMKGKYLYLKFLFHIYILFFLFNYLDDLAAKVAAHASDCYKEAYTSAKTESAKRIIPEVRRSLLFFI